jgi:hypothetical protein
MYYTVIAYRWSIALGRDSLMRLTYLRELVCERNLVRDFLVSAEPIEEPVG